MYQEAIHRKYTERAELVAICDTNPGRLKRECVAKQKGRAEPKVYAAGDFEQDDRTRPSRETVIVTTVNATHDDYIRAGDVLGCDVITEKPMTTDAQKCQSILDTRRATGKKCTVTFNYRYTPVALANQGAPAGRSRRRRAVGRVQLVARHRVTAPITSGAGTATRRHSGGLMVHKATHHFDLVNWWLSAMPVSVRAVGRRDFYTPKMAKRLGLASHHERCRTCPEKTKCSFELDLAGIRFEIALPRQREARRLPARSLRVSPRHRHRGRDERRRQLRLGRHALVHAERVARGKATRFASTARRAGSSTRWRSACASFRSTSGPRAPKRPKCSYIRVYPLRPGRLPGRASHRAPAATTAATPCCSRDLFGPPTTPDPLQRAADERAGAYSILVGVAANLSMASDKPVRIADLVKNLDPPDVP